DGAGGAADRLPCLQGPRRHEDHRARATFERRAVELEPNPAFEHRDRLVLLVGVGRGAGALRDRELDHGRGPVGLVRGHLDLVETAQHPECLTLAAVARNALACHRIPLFVVVRREGRYSPQGSVAGRPRPLIRSPTTLRARQAGQLASVQAWPPRRRPRRRSPKRAPTTTRAEKAARAGPLAWSTASRAAGPSRSPSTRWSCRNTLLPSTRAGRARRVLKPDPPAATTVSVRSPGVPRPMARAGRPRRCRMAVVRCSRSSVRPTRGPRRWMTA